MKDPHTTENRLKSKGRQCSRQLESAGEVNRLTCNLCKVLKEGSPSQSSVSQSTKCIYDGGITPTRVQATSENEYIQKPGYCFYGCGGGAWGLCPAKGKSLGVLAEDSLLPSKGCGRLIRW